MSARTALQPLTTDGTPSRLILDQYRQECGNPASGVMFPNGGGKPIDLNNVLNRVIFPVLNRCATCHKSEAEHDDRGHRFRRDESLPRWHGWHAARRALATNLHDFGVDDLTIQRILRHSNVTTTQGYYIKTLPTQVTDAMDKLERALFHQCSTAEPVTRRKSLN